MEQEYCAGLAGKGSKKGEACYNCVSENDHKFANAGCWTGGKTGRPAFLKEFCGPTA